MQNTKTNKMLPKKAIMEGAGVCRLRENQQLSESVGGIILASPMPITG